MEKNFQPQQVEPRIYQRWEEQGTFKPEINPNGKAYTISMPPPNATGTLHLGHAIMLAIEDAMIRRARMQGRSALLLPGTDHAAIATETRVIQNLQQDGIKDPRTELGRRGLLEKIHEFVEGSKSTIREQTRKMGTSCDWSREGYTMEATLSRVVNEVFLHMFQKGLIYRGDRIVNWDPKLQTTVSDIEIERKEKITNFYYLQFGPFEIGTARPETKFGDKYVVVHPEDERYADFEHGQTFECEWINGPITATLLKDESIDPEFGTGAMTITPWHDALDFEIAERYGLEKVQVIDFEGKLLSIAGEFEGQEIHQARPQIVEKLKQKGLLNRVDDSYTQNAAINSRGKGVIEPQIKTQWFIDVKKEVVDWQEKQMSLQQILQQVVSDEQPNVEIIPQRFTKIYNHWAENLRDWCISRQIWWGHQVPVWYLLPEQSDQKQPPAVPSRGQLHWLEEEQRWLYVGVEAPTGENWQRDEDTLDTWFSSAFWTWSTLIDKSLAEQTDLELGALLEQSADFQKFHPTQVLETGYDILPFWVMRMILMTTANTGQIPFETVYLHGLVRTRDGSKMSKSNPESVIDPVDVVQQYGADALRLALVVGQTPGNDSRIYEEKIKGYRNFCTKLWNASRFILFSRPDEFYQQLSQQAMNLNYDKRSLPEQWLLEKLSQTTNQVNQYWENYHLGEAGHCLYDFVWNDLCDWSIEIAKVVWNGNDIKQQASMLNTLVQTLEQTLKLLHPYIPFITEEIWQLYRERLNTLNWPSQWLEHLITANWPESTEAKKEDEKAAFSLFQEIVGEVRRLRAEHQIDKQAEAHARLVFSDVGKNTVNEQALRQLESLFLGITPLHSVAFVKNKLVEVGSNQHEDKHFFTPRPGLIVEIRFEQELDPVAEKERLKGEQQKAEHQIQHSQSLLNNEKFVARAPDQVVQAEQQKLAEARAKLKLVQEQLEKL